MVKAVSLMIPQGLVHIPADEKIREEQDEKNYKEAVRCIVVAQDELNSNAPFITQCRCVCACSSWYNIRIHYQWNCGCC